MYVNWNGAGGVRDPWSVSLPRSAGTLPKCRISRAARNLYGVVLLHDGSLDVGGTGSLRKSMRAERTATAISQRGRSASTALVIDARRIREPDDRESSAPAVDIDERIPASDGHAGRVSVYDCGLLLDSEVTKAVRRRCSMVCSCRERNICCHSWCPLGPCSSDCVGRSGKGSSGNSIKSHLYEC